MNTKHTPGKIEVSADGFDGVNHHYPWRFLVTFEEGAKKAQAIDDCRHLERCWNTHDDLVAALDAFVHSYYPELSPDYDDTSLGAAVRQARAALAKAKGETK